MRLLFLRDEFRIAYPLCSECVTAFKEDEELDALIQGHLDYFLRLAFFIQCGIRDIPMYSLDGQRIV